MLSFDTYHGFWLFSLIPLLIFLERWKSRVRRVELTVLPILEPILRRTRKTTPYLFRLKRRYRVLLSVLVVCLLSVAFNGPRFTTSEPAPGDWLLVVDNTALAQSERSGRRLFDEIRAGVETFAQRLPATDRLILMITSPEPQFLHYPEEGPIHELLNAAEPPAGSVSVDQLLDLTAGVFSGRSLRGRIVASPRAHLWAEALAARGEQDLYLLPPSAQLAEGNAGIVAFDLRPSASTEGTFDLYFRLDAHGMDDKALPVALTNGEKVVFREKAPPGSALVRNGLDLGPGNVALEILASDAFTADNRVAAVVPEARVVTVAVRGSPMPFLREAIASHRGFRVVEGDAEPAAVDIFVRGVERDVERPTLVVRPEASFLDFRYLRYLDNPGSATFHPTHPVTRNLDFWNLRVAPGLLFTVPERYRVLGRAAQVPLVIAGEHRGKRLLVWNFNPLDGAVASEPSFPVLVRDSVEWLAATPEVAWRRAAGCPGLPWQEPWEVAVQGAPENLLCPPITAQGGAISVPNLSAVGVEPSGRRIVAEVDLTPYLLVGAGVLLAYGGLVHAYASEVT